MIIGKYSKLHSMQRVRAALLATKQLHSCAASGHITACRGPRGLPSKDATHWAAQSRCYTAQRAAGTLLANYISGDTDGQNFYYQLYPYENNKLYRSQNMN